MVNTAPSLLWLREDLRLADNTALHEIGQTPGPVLALYLATPDQWHQHHRAPRQWDLIARRLEWLKPRLEALGIPLLCLEVPDFDAQVETVLSLVRQFRIQAVHVNSQYEWNESQRDEHLATQLAPLGVRWFAYHDACILPPGSIRTGQDTPFKVFTPFRKAWLKRLHQVGASPRPVPEARPWPQDQAERWLGEGQGTQWHYPRLDSSAWPVTDEAIGRRLQRFVIERAHDYKKHRDFPALDGTSGLSAYLATGMLSPRQCLAALELEHSNPWEQPDSGAFCWLSELVWREFYRHVMQAFPRVSRNQPFQPYTAAVAWRWDEEALARWQAGMTGFPIVDAAMRQLLATGWMHNRLRMIVASFLTKDLHLHWQLGERWFSQQLIDGDLAANNGGWQWAASTGTDAQPYFRVFNPTTQGQRFDPKGEFIRCWVEELAEVPDKFIHQPHRWNGGSLAYPAPMVDHDQARKEAVTLFQQAKQAWEQRSTVANVAS